MEEALKNFTNVFVAIDIGGTNTRVSVGSMRESHQIAKFLASSKAALLEGLARVSRELRASAPQLHIVGACAALAGPILEGGRACAVTNYLGGDKRMELSDFVATGLCPSGKLVLLNDLEATCFGLIALDHPSSHLKLEHFFETLWAPDNRKPALHVEKKFCVLAVGTGLGSAAILWNGASKTFSVIPLEAGHSVVQGYGPEHPGYQDEVKLFRFLADRDFKSAHAPEYESFASGRGLAHLYEFCSGGNLLVPAEVAKAGVAEVDAAASQALLLHYRYLMRCAQNLCVTLLLKDGVFFAGDNGVANGPWVRRNFDQLHAEFLNHSKRDWISETPLFAQTKETNFNLLGAIYQAETNFK